MTTVTSKCLVEAGYATNAQTTIYTAPTGTRVILDKMTLSNNSGANQTIAINIVPSGGSADATNLVVPALTVVNGDPPSLCPGIVGQVLNPGDFVSVIASANTAIVRRLSGREITS